MSRKTLSNILAEEETFASAGNGRNGHSSSNPSRSPSRGSYFYLLFVLTLSLSLACLVSLRNQTAASSQEAIKNFQWMVLVEGSQLEIDEVGRSLRQLPGVQDVTFVSKDDAFSSLKEDQMLFEDLNLFGPDDLPSSWRVTWLPEALDSGQMDDFIHDTQRLAGVTDIAFDRKTIDVNKRIRQTLYQLNLILSALMLIGAVFVALLLGRTLFFTHHKKFDGRRALVVIAQDQIAWAIGFFLVRQRLGSLGWKFLIVGLIVGAVHSLWFFYESER